MNAFSIETAQELVERQELRLMARGHSRVSARERIAAGVGVSPGTLENLRRGRMKYGRGFKGLSAMLSAFLAREIQAEIGRLTHEMDMVRQGSGDVDPAAVVAAEDLVAQAKALLAEGRGR